MRRPIAGLAVVGLGASLAAMDLAVNVAFPSITAAFALQTEEIRWLVGCYVLTYASLMLAFGKLGDRIGHRAIFRAGLALSIAAYAFCALAPSYGWLLAARVVQGVATALVLSCAPALATFLFAESLRTRALGAYSSLFAIAGIVAPVIGGASIAAFGWAGVFWFRVPVAMLAAAMLPLLPAGERAIAGHRPDADRVHLAGSIVLAAGLALVLLAIMLAQSPSARGYGAIGALCGAGLLAAFASQQRRAASPLLPAAVARDPAFLLPNVASIVLHLAAFAVPLLTPYYLERIAGLTPLASGTALACSPCGIFLGAAAAAAIVRRAGARRAALAGGALVVVGQFAIGIWTDTTALAIVLLSLALQGFGIGVFGVAYSDIVVAAMPRSDRGVAGSLTMVTRTVGVIAGAAALIALLGTFEERGIAAGLSARAAFLHAYGSVFVCSAGLVAIVLPLCLVRLPRLRT